jgi:hypothetical protein
MGGAWQSGPPAGLFPSHRGAPAPGPVAPGTARTAAWTAAPTVAEPSQRSPSSAADDRIAALEAMVSALHARAEAADARAEAAEARTEQVAVLLQGTKDMICLLESNIRTLLPQLVAQGLAAALGHPGSSPAAAVAAPTGTGPPPVAVASPPVPAESWEEHSPPEVASATAAIGTKRARELSPGPDSSSTALVLCSDGLTAAPLLAVAGAPGVKRPARGTTPSSVAMDLDDHPTLALVPAASASTPMIGQGPAAGRAS